MAIAPPRPAQLNARPARGFTLIELLVVVAVMSSVALLTFGVATEDRAQLRYNDTRTRLGQLERAILGRLGPVDAASVGGFVADNGDLPTSIAQLLAADANWKTQAALAPIFDPKPDTKSCENNGDNGNDEISLVDSSALLVKGHRGNYLGGAAFNGRFRDGWGNESSTGDDASNFGWIVKPDSGARSLTITSLGADNVANDPNASDFTADVARTISSGEWLVPIGGWSVGVANYSGVDIAAKKFSASLLVFHNDGTTSRGHWRRYSTAVSSVCLDGTGDGLVAGVPCPQSVTLSFTAGCFPDDKAAGHDMIPQGRHLLVLVSDPDGVPWNNDDSVSFVLDGLLPTRPISVTQITAIAGMALPAARLEIR